MLFRVIILIQLKTKMVLFSKHYNDIIMRAMASQITSPTIVYSTVIQGADQRKHQSSASLAFVRGIHRWPVNSPHKGPVTRKMFPFDDVIMGFKIQKGCQTWILITTTQLFLLHYEQCWNSYCCHKHDKINSVSLLVGYLWQMIMMIKTLWRYIIYQGRF